MTRAPLATQAAAPPLVPLLCLLALSASAVAQSATPPPQQSSPAQSQPAPPATRQPAQQPASAPLVRLNLIVTDESGRSVADVRREEISVLEDGRPQNVTHFAMEELPVSYGMVIDNSRSVGSLLSYLQRAAGTLALNNRPGDETFVLRFVHADEIVQLQDFTSNPDELAKALTSLYASGGQTAVIDATYLAVEKAAARRKGDAGRRRAVVLISDCEDRSSYHKREELIKLLRREGVQVFVISFLIELSDERRLTRPSPRERARKLAEEIAEESGGRAYFPKKPSELVAAVEEISRDLRSQYVLAYAPTNASADSKYRKVEVKIADAPSRPKRLAVARPGYFGAGAPPPGQPAKK